MGLNSGNFEALAITSLVQYFSLLYVVIRYDERLDGTGAGEVNARVV